MWIVFNISRLQHIVTGTLPPEMASIVDRHAFASVVNSRCARACHSALDVASSSTVCMCRRVCGTSRLSASRTTLSWELPLSATARCRCSWWAADRPAPCSLDVPATDAAASSRALPGGYADWYAPRDAVGARGLSWSRTQRLVGRMLPTTRTWVWSLHTRFGSLCGHELSRNGTRTLFRSGRGDLRVP